MAMDDGTADDLPPTAILGTDDLGHQYRVIVAGEMPVEFA